MRHILLSIKVSYDESTVEDMSILVAALHQKLSDFVARGSLTPLKSEVIEHTSFGVEVVDAG